MHVDSLGQSAVLVLRLFMFVVCFSLDVPLLAADFCFSHLPLCQLIFTRRHIPYSLFVSYRKTLCDVMLPLLSCKLPSLSSFSSEE